MVLNHSGRNDVDAIPILSADDEYHNVHDDPILADNSEQQHHHPHLFPRRKHHTGILGGRSKSSNSIVRQVRRRGSSVPCDMRFDEQDSATPQYTRGRAGSATTAEAHARFKGDQQHSGGTRRRAMSGILSQFRRRGKEFHNHNAHHRNQQQQEYRSKRRVTFKTSLHADVMPNPCVQQPSYDELLFTVGGLYQTLSFLHDPVHHPDDSSTDSSSHHSADEIPAERSMLLMIAEFLYRSAVYLGYPTESKPWIPGFRETKRFSINDVKRWRRLAHHDWEKEEQEFQKQALVVVRSTKSGLRAAVSGWIQRRRRHSAPAKLSVPSPPPVPRSKDLSLLVTIANSCVSCGAFQFDASDILALCNVDIEAKLGNV